MTQAIDFAEVTAPGPNFLHAGTVIHEAIDTLGGELRARGQSDPDELATAMRDDARRLHRMLAEADETEHRERSPEADAAATACDQDDAFALTPALALPVGLPAGPASRLPSGRVRAPNTE